MSEEKKSGGAGKTLAAAAIGAAVGAAAVILSDKDKRQRIRSKIDQEKGRVELKAKDIKEKGRSRIVESLEAAKNKLENAEAEAQNGSGVTPKVNDKKTFE